MIEQLRQDIEQAPRAFSFTGPTDRRAVNHALAEFGHPAHDALRQLWADVGGGEMFETEEVLSPTADGPFALDDRNAELREAGLPADLLAFHAGLNVSAVDRSGSFLALDPHTFHITRRYDTLDDWYNDLRREYADTYGLGTLP